MKRDDYLNVLAAIERVDAPITEEDVVAALENPAHYDSQGELNLEKAAVALVGEHPILDWRDVAPHQR